MAEEKKGNGWLDQPSGIMANIFVEPKHIRRRFKMLDRFDRNLEIPQFFAYKLLATFLILMTFLVVYLMANFVNIKYIGIPILLFALALILVFRQLVFSHKGVSYLKLTFNLIKFSIVERKRRKTGEGLKSIGIDDVLEDGKILYSDGDMGYMFNIVGYGSRTMLPQTIAQVRRAQADYLRVRLPHTMEEEIIKISLANPKKQLDSNEELQKIHKELGADGDPNLFHAWSNFMLAQNKQFIEKQIKGKEHVFEQNLIVRAGTEEVLKRQVANFEASSQIMLYSQRKLTQKEVKDFYSEMLMMK